MQRARLHLKRVSRAREWQVYSIASVVVRRRCIAMQNSPSKQRAGIKQGALPYLAERTHHIQLFLLSSVVLFQCVDLAFRRRMLGLSDQKVVRSNSKTANERKKLLHLFE